MGLEGLNKMENKKLQCQILGIFELSATTVSLPFPVNDDLVRLMCQAQSSSHYALLNVYDGNKWLRF